MSDPTTQIVRKYARIREWVRAHVAIDLTSVDADDDRERLLAHLDATGRALNAMSPTAAVYVAEGVYVAARRELGITRASGAWDAPWAPSVHDRIADTLHPDWLALDSDGCDDPNDSVPERPYL